MNSNAEIAARAELSPTGVSPEGSFIDAKPASSPISECIELSKSYPARSGLREARGARKFVQAIDRVSLRIYPGESMGLVGESGSGKSTLGRLLIRLETPTAGDILFDGVHITRLRGRRLRKRRQQMQMIFQDPASSLNPRFTAFETIAEALEAHGGRMKSGEKIARVEALSQMVGFSTDALQRYPKELSSGEKQRVSIARSLAVEPRFLVADEPIASLDLSSQAQLIRLLQQLQQNLHLTLLLITHDLETVRTMCSRVAVMYLGRIVEIANTADLLVSAAHPYTRALISATLSCDPDFPSHPTVLTGESPSPLDPPAGCHFHPRCPHADVQCRLLVPEERFIGASRMVRCHFDFDGEHRLTPQIQEDSLTAKDSIIPPPA